MNEVRKKFNKRANKVKGMKAELIRRCAHFASKPTVIAALKGYSEFIPAKHQRVLKVAKGML